MDKRFVGIDGYLQLEHDGESIIVDTNSTPNKPVKFNYRKAQAIHAALGQMLEDIEPPKRIRIELSQDKATYFGLYGEDNDAKPMTFANAKRFIAGGLPVTTCLYDEINSDGHLVNPVTNETD